MLQPLARKGGRALPPVASIYSAPAPIGGWNARDSIADMAETDAPIMRNWFPGKSRIRVRRGFEEFATGLGGAVESLMTYASPTAQKMFGAANGKVFEASIAGAVGAAALSGKTNNRWQYANMGTAGGHFLVMVNGADTPEIFDGSSWSTSPAITGVTATALIGVNVYKRRLFFPIKDTLSFAFLAVETIGGAASTFDLGPECQLGGYLMAMGTWTRDGGDGMDDFAVFYTSRGELLVYQGSDPGDPTDWSLVGRFTGGAPIGRRCMVKAGPDLILLSQDGFIPLSTALQAGRVTNRGAISDKIRNAVNDAVRDWKDHFGWQGTLYPHGTMAVFNIPKVEGVTSSQYVANTNTGAWCEFTGMNANCFEVFNDLLYFGGDGAVYLADSGFDDNGADIDADCQQASTYLGAQGIKSFRRIRPVMTTDGQLNMAVAVNVDFEDTSPDTTPSFSTPSGATWDVTAWDTEFWVGGPSISKDWIYVEGVGHAGAIRLHAVSQGFEIFWNSTDWLYEVGGPV